MRPARPIPEEDVVRLEAMLRAAKSATEVRRVQCVLMRARLGLSPEEIAKATGYKRSTVQQIQSAYLRCGEQALRGPGRGGRRHQHMTRDQEAHFLEAFVDRATEGGILEVGAIKAAYEKAIGRVVPKSTVYRLLARHGWRKLAPRPRHPKTKPLAQDAWKKNSPTSSPSTPAKPNKKAAN